MRASKIGAGNATVVTASNTYHSRRTSTNLVSVLCLKRKLSCWGDRVLLWQVLKAVLPAQYPGVWWMEKEWHGTLSCLLPGCLVCDCGYCYPHVSTFFSGEIQSSRQLLMSWRESDKNSP